MSTVWYGPSGCGRAERPPAALPVRGVVAEAARERVHAAGIVPGVVRARLAEARAAIAAALRGSSMQYVPQRCVAALSQVKQAYYQVLALHMPWTSSACRS